MSASKSSAKFDLHLPGLLKVLAEHLYSDRRVGLRELLQNAHDSCSRRRIEAADGFKQRIHVSVDRENDVLQIDDNGCGLTESEIVNYLATIGRGYTRELREESALTDPESYRELIGQFGLGFLSAFLIASEVEVHTLSFQSASKPMIWRSCGDETYDLLDGHRETIGTTIRLKCKPSMRFLLKEDALMDLVQMYCDMLPVPIYVGHRRYPINRQHAPWASDDFETAWHDFVESHPRAGDALWKFQLEDWCLDLGHDSVQIPLSGVVYVPSRSTVSLNEFGDASVYIRNMFITDSNRSLLPSWARFLRAYIESPMLQPTASREDIHEDENFELVQQAIEQQLLQAIRQLCEEDIRRWNLIVDCHTDLIMGWAANCDDFFDHIADCIQLRTTRGMMTVEQYRAECPGGKIYYETTRSPSFFEQVLLEGQAKPVIDATWFGVLPFLHEYARRDPTIHLVRTDSDLHTLMRDVPTDHFSDLLAEFKRICPKTRLAEFQPSAIPAVFLYSEHAEFIAESEEALSKDQLFPGVADAISSIVESLMESGESTEGILTLNANSPLVRQLADSARDGTLERPYCELLCEMAKLFSGRMMDARKIIQSFDTFSGAIMEIVK
ncbi:ATP-binding protein [Stieleria sp. JC731]|uniref:ATP-binding protein n=1 Tax=Pirellulaceae TaxID=2691357 RepID=UPI001E2B8E85|nr:ATP-binding protein [Stieleria sp. JC731]MCC9600084.1 ATP-binding protein [Stieleria sp. JC731]